MAKQRRPQGGRRNDNEFVPRWEFEQLKAELRGEIQRSERQIPVWINIEPDPAGGPGGDDSYVWRFRGTADRSLEATAVTTDGVAPGSSPTPVMTGGITMLFIKWDPIVNADEVTYEVHLSTSSGFTPSAATLLTDTQGFMVTTRTLPDGTPLAQATTYYTKIIARDADSAAAASAEDSAQLAQVTEPDIASDQIIARHILAEEIHASHLEASLVLLNTLIAGQPGSTRIEIGVSEDEEDSFIGIRAFDSEGLDTLRVDADTGKLYVRGEIAWGTQSMLDEDDVILIAEQETAFNTPTMRQKSSGGAYAAGDVNSVNRTFGSPSLAGNLLVRHVFQWRAGTSTPTALSDPVGWTAIENRTGSGTIGASTPYRSRQQVWYRENAPSQTSFSHTFSGTKPTHAIMDVMEIRNTALTGAFDQEVSDVGAYDVSVSVVGATGTLAQNVEYALGLHCFMVHSDDAPFGGPPQTIFFQDTGGGTGSYVGGAITPNDPRVVPTVGCGVTEEVTSGTSGVTHELEMDSSPSGFGAFPGFESYLLTFKAKAAAVATPSSAFVKLYGKQVVGSAQATALHTIGEDGVEMSLLGAQTNKRFQLLRLTATHNIGNVAAHTGTSVTMTVTGAAVGDFVMSVQRTDAANARTFLLSPEPVVTVADQVQFIIFNTDAAARDPDGTTYHFYLLRPL